MRTDDEYYANLAVFQKICENLPKRGKRGNSFEPFWGEIRFNNDDALTETLGIWLASDTTDYGKISHDNGERLKAFKTYTKFLPRWQHYVLEEGNVLCIKADESELMGKYEARIKYVRH